MVQNRFADQLIQNRIVSLLCGGQSSFIASCSADRLSSCSVGWAGSSGAVSAGSGVASVLETAGSDGCSVLEATGSVRKQTARTMQAMMAARMTRRLVFCSS